MKKMNKKYIAGTAFAVSAAAALVGCGIPQPSVYGPAPSDLVETIEDTSEAQETTGLDVTTEETSTTVSPGEDVAPPVYGPPESEEIQPVNEFDPENEVQEDVYGPPEYFD